MYPAYFKYSQAYCVTIDSASICNEMKYFEFADKLTPKYSLKYSPKYSKYGNELPINMCTNNTWGSGPLLCMAGYSSLCELFFIMSKFYFDRADPLEPNFLVLDNIDSHLNSLSTCD